MIFASLICDVPRKFADHPVLVLPFFFPFTEWFQAANDHPIRAALPLISERPTIMVRPSTSGMLPTMYRLAA
jgi:hypothetical protein